MRQATAFRGLLARDRLRQALAESQAWTPIESPWQLPIGLLGWACDFGRPSSRRTSWLAASDVASPTAGPQKEPPAGPRPLSADDPVLRRALELFKAPAPAKKAA